jgi:hypothetical protein
MDDDLLEASDALPVRVLFVVHGSNRRASTQHGRSGVRSNCGMKVNTIFGRNHFLLWMRHMSQCWISWRQWISTPAAGGEKSPLRAVEKGAQRGGASVCVPLVLPHRANS